MNMSKRRRFALTSLLLSMGFIGIQFITDQNRFWAIGILLFLTIALFVWSLWENLGRNTTLSVLVLPTMFTAGVGIFWFLLPANIYTRIPIVIFYGIGIYVLCLTMNIFSVAAVRTIALLRAARGVGFILSLVTSFLIFDTILSLRADLHLLLPMIFFVSFPLLFQGFWMVSLERQFNREIVLLSLIGALVCAEVSALLFFWPVSVVVGSLFLTVSFYVLLGLGQAYVEERLFPAVVREHVIVGLIVFIAMFFATHWGG